MVPFEFSVALFVLFYFPSLAKKQEGGEGEGEEKDEAEETEIWVPFEFSVAFFV